MRLLQPWSEMNKPIVNVEAKIFLYAFAILGLGGGIYSFIGLGILESDGVDLNTLGGSILQGLSFAAMIAAVGRDVRHLARADRGLVDSRFLGVDPGVLRARTRRRLGDRTRRVAHASSSKRSTNGPRVCGRAAPEQGHAVAAGS